MCELAVDALLKVSALRRTCDNITTVVIGFDNFFSSLLEYTNAGKFEACECEVIEDSVLHAVYAPYLNSASRVASISLSAGR